jgi:hypothetical protein
VTDLSPAADRAECSGCLCEHPVDDLVPLHGRLYCVPGGCALYAQLDSIPSGDLSDDDAVRVHDEARALVKALAPRVHRIGLRRALAAEVQRRATGTGVR